MNIIVKFNTTTVTDENGVVWIDGGHNEYTLHVGDAGRVQPIYLPKQSVLVMTGAECITYMEQLESEHWLET